MAQYRKRVESFAAWLRVSCQLSLTTLLWFTDARPAAAYLAAYVQLLYDEGETVSAARYTVAGLQYFFKYLRHRLQAPWSAIREWQILEPGLPRVPMPH